MDLIQKKKALQGQLLSYWQHYGREEAVKKIKELATSLKSLGVDLGNEQTLDKLSQNPEAFTTLVSLYEFGVIKKLSEAKELLS